MNVPIVCFELEKIKQELKYKYDQIIPRLKELQTNNQNNIKQELKELFIPKEISPINKKPIENEDGHSFFNLSDQELLKKPEQNVKESLKESKKNDQELLQGQEKKKTRGRPIGPKSKKNDPEVLKKIKKPPSNVSKATTKKIFNTPVQLSELSLSDLDSQDSSGVFYTPRNLKQNKCIQKVRSRQSHFIPRQAMNHLNNPLFNNINSLTYKIEHIEPSKKNIMDSVEEKN